MRKLIMGAAVALPLAFAGTAQADTVTTSFDSFTDGTVNNQGGWTAGAYDQAVVPFGTGKALRISNAITDGSFAFMPYSTPVIHAAGENEGNNVLTNEFTFKAPATYVPELAVSISPTGAGGSRMSYIRLEDSAAGVKVVFRDGTFADQLIDTLDRSVPHTIKFETTFVKGDDNDVVRIFIDGNLAKRGASWENYYRLDEERNPATTDRLMWRLNLTPSSVSAAAAINGNGVVFDNVTSKSSHVDNPAPLNPPVMPVGPTGAAGTNGTDGVNGKDGAAGPAGKDFVPTAVRANTVAGATLRTLHVRKVAGMKFISARASLDGKSVRTIRGRTIKVDLRGKSVGRYRVFITAEYKAHGKVYKVHSTRTLRIVQK